MLDAALTAAQMIEKDLPHDAPAQTGSPAERFVHVGDADDILSNEVIDFARQRRLQAIGYVPGHLLA